MENKKIQDSSQQVVRDFKLTSLSLSNKNTVFLLTFVIVIYGLVSYLNMPKELFPEVHFPWVLVQTTYPGNPPLDIENLVTRPIEKELESVRGIKKINSVSAQDASMVTIEFNFDVDIKDALADVKDAVDKARNELPNDLPYEPLVMDIDASEFPIMNINLSGDYSIDELNHYAEILNDEIESVKEVSKVEIIGITSREVKISVDLYKMEANEVTFQDIENAVAFENMSISGGEVKVDGTIRSIRTVGEFTSMSQIEDIIVKSEKSKIVYLRDIAEVEYGFEEATSFARLDQQPVVSLQVIKKGGENLLSATRKIDEKLKAARENSLIPKDVNLLKINITNDQSEMIQKQLSNLENSMFISIFFVVVVLFFFLGTRNALFVGMAIPLSMLVSFIVLSILGYKINMMVLFGLILALGMLVDNAIVVVENIYRFVDRGYPRGQAARQAVGEIAIPIIASTATTLAAFMPLAFWDAMMGEFMKYLPITLIVVLTSSLFVALVIIPVFSSVLIKPTAEEKEINKPRALKILVVCVLLSLPFYLAGAYLMANILAFAAVITLCNMLFLDRTGRWFKDVFLGKMENVYLEVLTFALSGRNPIRFFAGTIVLMFLTFTLYIAVDPEVEFFPSGDPSYINIMAEMPIGTDIYTTDQRLKEMESYVMALLAPYYQDSVVKSVLTNVGQGAVLEDDLSSIGEAQKPDKGLITVTFVDFEKRKGVNSSMVMRMLSDSLLHRYPGVVMTIEKNRMGPPVGKPINLEVRGLDYDVLIALCDELQDTIDKSGIAGIEGLRMDMDLGRPEMLVTIKRDAARKFGMSTAQIAGTIRTALFGKEISDYKEGEDEYPIQLRLKKDYRDDINSLMNQLIIFRDNEGKLMKIPISSVADFHYSSTYGSVRRKDLKRVITLYSNVIEGYNANLINTKLKTLLSGYPLPKGYEVSFTGEQEEQQESMAFLARALLIAVALIMLILVSQFNSVVKPFIIIASVVFSTIGVFGGLATFNLPFVVVMTGIGIVSLAGVVVNNAIVLIDYIDLLKARRRKELGVEEGHYLPVHEAVECIVLAGKTRLRPVLLTAITTILGLVPMAVQLNINISGLFNRFEPEFYFGGDMAAIWAPISLTVIFGLAFATFLTLVIVPVMYKLASQIKYRKQEAE